MDDVPLDDAPPSAAHANANAEKWSPPSVSASLGSIGAVGASHDADPWGGSLHDASFPVAAGGVSHAMVGSVASAEHAVVAAALPSGGSAASANPFDAFDDFAPPPTSSSSSLSLPPPMAISAPHAVSLGSPLISFSPVVGSAPPPSASQSLVAPPVSSSSVAAIDDLLSFSFSPVAAVAAPPTSMPSLMDDFFFTTTTTTAATSTSASATSSSFSASSSSAFDLPHAAQAETLSSSLTSAADASLLSFSPVAAAYLPPAPFSDSFLSADLADLPRGSFGGFDGAPSSMGESFVDMDGPRSAPAAFDIGATFDGDRRTAAALNEGQEAETLTAADTSVDEEDAEDVRKRIPHDEFSRHVEAEVVVETTSGDAAADHERDSMNVHEGHSERSSDVEETAAVSPVGVATTEAASGHFVIDTSATTVTSPLRRSSEWSSYGEVDSSEADADEAEAPMTSLRLSGNGVETTRQSQDDASLLAHLSPLSETGDANGCASLGGDADRGKYVEEDTSGFDAEVEAVYAQVNDDDDDLNRPSMEVHDHHALPEHLPIRSPVSVLPAETNGSPPSSDASSPGSSVGDSAFAFISAGASASSFSFGQPAESPRAVQEGGGGLSSSEIPAASTDGSVSPVSAEKDAVSPVGYAQFEAEDSVASHEELEEAPAPSKNSETAQEELGALGGSDTDSAQAQTTFPSPHVEVESASSGVVVHHGEPVSSPTLQSCDGAFAAQTVDEDLSSQSATVHAEGDDFTTTGDGSSFGFGSFGGAVAPSQPAADAFDGDDDGFGGFAQSNAGASTETALGDGDDEFDDFGGFEGGTSWANASGAGTTDFGDDDDGFGDFTPAPSISQQWGSVSAQSAVTSPQNTSWATPVEAPLPPIAAPTDLNELFAVAFPGSKAPVAPSLLPKASAFNGGILPPISANSVFEQAGTLHKCFQGSLQEYRAMLTGEQDDAGHHHHHHYHHHHPSSFESQAVRLKYLKYILTEKLNEASRHDGVFPHGSEKYQMFESIAESGHEKNMREALASLQEALFHSSVNEAVMRIAKQAALSAKARIAEQAAQQQNHGRGSLLATTRHFLSRSAGSSSSGPGSNEKDREAGQGGSRTGSGSLGVLTPTGASVQKLSRLSFPNGQEGEVGVSSSGYGSGEDTGSDVSNGDMSGHSESDLGGGMGSPAPPPSSSTSSGRGSGGGLMKKFSEKLTFMSSTKHKPRTVSLRRMGQSSEDVCKMELNMESISGGFDEVKWRCAVFLFETEEVAHLAPSQIKILAYPSNQLLAGKSDRSALSKFFKPGTIWSIDIGANGNHGVSME